MSFQITISPSRRAAARFVIAVRRAIQKAYVEEQKAAGLTQTGIARALGVHRSVINRELRGKKDLTLGRVAELAWAMGRVPTLEIAKNTNVLSSNLPPISSAKPNSMLMGIATIAATTSAPANNNAAPVALEMAN
jgi:Helix-turn-helix